MFMFVAFSNSSLLSLAPVVCIHAVTHMHVLDDLCLRVNGGRRLARGHKH